MPPVLERDSRGNEMQFSTNHLGHFQLTNRLWPALRRADGARVISVSSLGHHLSDIGWDDINFERREYEGWIAYGQSKTANVLFAVEVDRRGRDDGIRSFSLHPGDVVTGLAKHIPVEQLMEAGNLDPDEEAVIDPDKDMKSIPQGAATHIRCAVSQQIAGVGGVFCLNSDIATLDTGEIAPDGQRIYGVAPYVVDPGSVRRLWMASESLIGARFL